MFVPRCAMRQKRALSGWVLRPLEALIELDGDERVHLAAGKDSLRATTMRRSLSIVKLVVMRRAAGFVCSTSLGARPRLELCWFELRSAG